MLEFHVEIIDDTLNIVSNKQHYYNCSDKADMEILCSIVNDEICYLNETGADSERVISKVYELLNKYRSSIK